MEPEAAPTPPEPLNVDAPQWLRMALDAPPLTRRPWASSIAPTYIGLFLWVVYFDQFPKETLPRGGVGWSVIGAGLGGLFAYLLFYYAPAMWGFSTGRSTSVLAAGTFGARGAGWLAGWLVGIVHLIWFAVATDFGVRLTLLGLQSTGLLDPSYLATGITRDGRLMTNPLTLFTCLAWALMAALVGRWLVRVIAALMNIYPLLPALLLGAAVVAAFRGLPAFRPDLLAGNAGGTSAAFAVAVAIQMILGFFAASGLASAEWGAASRSADDVRRGGLVSVTFASWIIATLAVLAVAGTVERQTAVADTGREISPLALTFHATLRPLFGARLGGAMLMAFGLSALAPCVYTSFLFGTLLHGLWPRFSQLRWTLLGIVPAFLLIVSGMTSRLLLVFGIVGGLIAPLLGAIAADYMRSRGVWPGVRHGVNVPGLIAFAIGAAVGLWPLVAGTLGEALLKRGLPPVLLAFGAAFVTYTLLAAVGLESAPDREVAVPRLTE